MRKLKEKNEERQEHLDRTKDDSAAYTIEEIREQEMVAEDDVLIRKERLDDAYYPKFDMNI